MARTVAIGEQDFAKLVGHQYFYVDKTGFIKEWWEKGDTVTLITRPRRFGKTLTMNMLYYFYSVRQKGQSHLFENLNIWKDEKYRKMQGMYPVLFLSFASVKAGSYANAREGIIQELVDLYDQHAFLLDSEKLTAREKEAFRNLNEDMSDMAAARSLNRLCRLLHQHYGKKVIILLDEYDTPMQEAYVNGYWKEMADFMRSLLNAAFKTNLYLERGIMTGITRVGKESIFSDLNNLEVVTATSAKYDWAFGFTEEEVLQALEEFGMADQAQDVKKWYDGFHFGNCTSIYNPWSITQFLDKREFAAYWANTSSNKLAGKLIQKGSREVKMIMEDLMNGKAFPACVDEQIVFDQLDQNENAVWSLLLASGYLKASGHKINKKGKKEYLLDIVNLEVHLMFEDMFQNWFSVCDSAYHDFIKALLVNDVGMMNKYMNRVALQVTSSFDSGKHPSGKTEPERFYHGLVLGMMIDLEERYVMTSDRESGFGRYDVLLEPRDPRDDAIILEFKVCDRDQGDALPKTAESALRQMIEKRYAAVLEARGCPKGRIRIYGFAFRGKEVWICGGYMEDMERIGKG